MTNENLKKCGFCGENIPFGAGRCPYCGSILNVEIKDSYGPNDEAGNTGEAEPPRDMPVETDSSFNQDMEKQNTAFSGTGAPSEGSPPLSNGLKVFLTILFTILPGIGQLAGIITAIIFMNADGDNDRKSFGVALLVACLVLFVLSCIGCLIISIAASSIPYLQ